MTNKDLMIYQDIQNPTLKLVLDALENEYGSILTNVGGMTGEKWISPKAITVLIHQLDINLRGKNNEKIF